MSIRASILAIAAVTALAACGDSGKVELTVTERLDVYPGGQISCEVRGTLKNNEGAELRRIEFDLTAGERRSIHGGDSNIPANGQSRFSVLFVGTACGNLPNRLGIETKRCYFRGDRDCSTVVALRQ